MDSEKDLLKRDLGKAESKEEIESLIDDAEAMGGHEDVVELARKKLEAVLAKAQSVETTPPAQITQVESIGGSADEIGKRTEAVDAQIDAVKTDTESRIAEVKGTTEKAVELDPESKAIYDKYRDEWNNLLTQNDMYQQAHGFVKNPEGIKEVRNFKGNIAMLENQLAPYLDLDFSYAKTPDTGEVVLISYDPSLKSEDKYKIGMSISKLVNQPEFKRMLEMTSDISDRGKVLKLRDLFNQMLEKTNFWLNAAAESEKGEVYVKERSTKAQKDLSDLEAKRDKELAGVKKVA